MTAQFTDTVRFQGRDYHLAGINGRGLFEPAERGLSPVATSTANWRGYYCTYTVTGGHLLLDTLSIGLQGDAERLAKHGAGPLLFGKSPVGREPCGNGFRYEGLAAPVAFTGKLLLGDDFVQDLYVHMGFHPAWKYRVVQELEFQDGRLLAATDRSLDVQAFRERITAADLRPSGHAGPDELGRWIERAFSRDYADDDWLRPPVHQ